jgi:phospho-N-acetylmuramoyl-pentapeptide-transferase
MTSLILTKIFSLTSFGFVFALLATPLLTHYLYKYKLGKNIRDDGTTPIFTKLHKDKKGTPTLGGVLVWGTVTVIAALIWISDRILDIPGAHVFNFLTRKETLLPLGAFLGASLVGLADDFLDINRMGHKGRGFPFRFKVFLYTSVAVIGAWWFYFKLGFDYIHIPFYGNLFIGWLFIPFFILIVVGTSFAVNETDGLDGLAGGTLLIAFLSYTLIAYMIGRENLASFIGVVCGSLLAFLWFNVFPARFIMGDTGSMGMGVLLAIVAFLTNSVLLLPLIGFIFVVEAGSAVMQILSKKFLGKKIFLSAPIHHHYEALGWPETKVTMRFWIIAAVTNLIGVIIFFLDRYM